jgi:hypothetical protein
MRIYDVSTIQEQEVTGFQSACAEFAQGRLSLDEKCQIGNPAIKLLTINSDVPGCDLQRGDHLVIDCSIRPLKNDLVILRERVVRFTNAAHFEDVEILGVVVKLLRDFV